MLALKPSGRGLVSSSRWIWKVDLCSQANTAKIVYLGQVMECRGKQHDIDHTTYQMLAVIKFRRQAPNTQYTLRCAKGSFTFYMYSVWIKYFPSLHDIFQCPYYFALILVNRDLLDIFLTVEILISWSFLLQRFWWPGGCCSSYFSCNFCCFCKLYSTKPIYISYSSPKSSGQSSLTQVYYSRNNSYHKTEVLG